jgi:hypothetical protein
MRDSITATTLNIIKGNSNRQRPSPRGERNYKLYAAVIWIYLGRGGDSTIIGLLITFKSFSLTCHEGGNYERNCIFTA